MIGARL